MGRGAARGRHSFSRYFVKVSKTMLVGKRFENSAGVAATVKNRNNINEFSIDLVIQSIRKLFCQHTVDSAVHRTMQHRPKSEMASIRSSTRIERLLNSLPSLIESQRPARNRIREPIGNDSRVPFRRRKRTTKSNTIRICDIPSMCAVTTNDRHHRVAEVDIHF